MELYSRFQCEVVGARDRARQLQREAAEQRLVREFRTPSPLDVWWRLRLAAQLHALAERLEPHSFQPLGEAPRGDTTLNP